MSSEKSLLKNSFGVSLATLASRILGLLRVKLEAMALGGGATASIWFITLMIPNLLRRLLGEGALGMALTPVIAETERRSGIPQVRLVLAQVLSVAGAVLAGCVVLISATALFTGRYASLYGSGFWQSQRLLGVCQLLPLMMPYAFFICLTGIIGAVLNYAGMFVRPALTALFFNICMIGGLSAGAIWELPSQTLLKFLAILTPASGAVQLLLMLWMLRSCGRFPDFSRRAFRSFEITRKVIKLATPGIIGYGVLQLSFLIDRSMAVYLGDQAVPALTYVDRIVDLPIGLFAVSFGSVLMASMTHAAADNDWEAMQRELNFSIRHVWFIGAPMAAAVIFFHNEIIRVLCLGGKYTLADLEAAKYVAVFYGFGIPFFCSLKVILPAFYSRKDMKRPFYVSLAAISVNLILNLLLMFPLQQGGLALATVIASVVNNSLLLMLLRKDGLTIQMRSVISAIRSVVIAAVSGAAVWCLLPVIRRYTVTGNQLISDTLVLGITGLLFGGFFLILAFAVHSPELRELLSIVSGKRKRHKQNYSA
ncbi:MAG: murein biosynthesis integral membrane protein MurJ [Lentisphaeria bacterium]|nr:murein biosynthesis integral membrane protein MurJ [Lentisphaeria bacterium]